MPTKAQIKAAARKLPAADRADLLEEFARDKAVQEEQLARLRAMIEEGEKDLREGRYIEIKTKAEHRAFFDEIKRQAKARLKRSA